MSGFKSRQINRTVIPSWERGEDYQNKMRQARQMRQRPTLAEEVLWGELRAKQLGVRFGRQRLCLGWIVDFYCPSKMIAIEVDGEYHADKQAKDRFRDESLRKHGIVILRFSNRQVLEELGTVVDNIKTALTARA